MVDSELVAVGAEAQARLTDLGVMPKPGGEGEQAKPDYRRRNPQRTYGGLHPGAWKAFSKAGFWAPPWLSAVGMPGWLMEAVNPVPGGQDGGSALAGLAATPTAASAPANRSAPKRRLMKHTLPFAPPQRRRAQPTSEWRVEQAVPPARRPRQGPPCAMIVTMAYDEDLAKRIRELIASEDGYTEQKMFGGIGFMIDGHMAVGSAARVA